MALFLAGMRRGSYKDARDEYTNCYRGNLLKSAKAANIFNRLFMIIHEYKMPVLQLAMAKLIYLLGSSTGLVPAGPNSGLGLQILRHG